MDSIQSPTEHDPSIAPIATDDEQRDEKERLDAERTSWRFGAVAIFFITATLLIVVRLISYQLFPNQRADQVYAAPAETPARGSIVDRGGNILSIDRYFYDISATPENLTDDEMREVATKIAELVDLDPNELLATLVEFEERPYCLLAKGLTLDQTSAFMSFLSEVEQAGKYSPFEYVQISASPQRHYPEGDLGSHILGFVGIDVTTNSGRAGHYGLESYYDRFLSANGVGLPTKPNGTLDDLPSDAVRYLPSLPRKDLVLTLDRGMQWIAEDELDYALRYFRAQSGSIIAMDPRTGEILALASLPTFDPNEFATAEGDTFANPTVNLQYEPGSIFKTVTMAAALDTGVISPTMVLTDTGSISVGGRVFLNSNRRGFGRITIADALANSVNVITVQVAQLLGDEDFYHYVRRFGFGQPTGIDLAGEVNGLLKSPGDPNWSVSDLAANSFGQGMAVTPLQMLSAVAALANDGRYMRPYIVNARVAGEEVLFTEPTVVREVVSPETARAMAEMMEYAVNAGIRAARIPGYSVAGKTGTAQIPTEDGYTEDETITTFVGFVPADDPQIVVLVKLDRPDPAISQWAAYTAAPTFARVTKRFIDYLNIPPDEIRLSTALSSQDLSLATESE
jgi:cell division protein FtsI/penicillin-binding protein 2